MFWLSFGRCNDEISAQILKGNKAYIHCYCNTVKCSAGMTGKKAFRRPTKNKNKNISVVKQYMYMYPTRGAPLQHSELTWCLMMLWVMIDVFYQLSLNRWSEWDQLVIGGRCFPGEPSLLNDGISAQSFAEMWFRISVCVKTVALCLEFSSLESCRWYMSFTFSELWA